MKFEVKEKQAELVIVGAGIAGVCAALQAARMGVLINDRGVVGGNNSVEIFVGLGGACDGNSLNLNLREGGIVDELRQEYKYRSPHNNRYALDGVLMDMIYAEEAHLSLFLNTCVDEVETDGKGRITAVSGTQNSTETRWVFRAAQFIDDTGDGALGALSGASFMLGREAASTFGERVAPQEADSFCIPTTLNFVAKDMGFPVKYIPPHHADDIAGSGALKYRTIPHHDFDKMKWFYEASGELDQVKDREAIMRQHRGLVTGIWNHIKNSGEYPEAENYDFEYISCVPGVREYRRLKGDYILTENDLVNQVEHDDAVGHGGWNIDLHAIRGFYDTDLINRHIHFQGPYQIPYRCGYSENVENLFMCGRCMSTSHVAFGSTRVAATLATLGQAVGMAAFLCKAHGTTPRGVYQDHRKELQQRLLREDQLILNVKNEDPNDHALRAKATASSCMALSLPAAQGREYAPIRDGVALVIPVRDRLDTLAIHARCGEATALTIRVHKPSKPYNFGPDDLLRTFTVAIPKGAHLVELPVNITQGNSYYFIELTDAPALELRMAPGQLPTTMMFQKTVNTETNVWDYRAMRMMDTHWWRVKERCLCFETVPAQAVYEPENINNGYSRACGQPNAWLSAPGDDTPWVTLTFDTPVTLTQCRITFFMDTTATMERYAAPLFPGVAQDYAVWAVRDGVETLVAEVWDNHMKCNQLMFESTLCDALLLRFRRTVDNLPVGIYEIRAE